jgi:hypothetical protein
VSPLKIQNMHLNRAIAYRSDQARLLVTSIAHPACPAGTASLAFDFYILTTLS